MAITLGLSAWQLDCGLLILLCEAVLLLTQQSQAYGFVLLLGIGEDSNYGEGGRFSP